MTGSRGLGTQGLEIGGREFILRSGSAAFLRLARDRYAGFLGGAPAGQPRRPVTATYRVVSAAPSTEVLHRARGEAMTGSMAAGATGDLRTFAGAGFTAVLDRDALTLEIEGPLAIYPLDLMIRAFMVEVEGALVMHAAALADGGRGFLLTGPSGAGKSTLAGLFPRRALCDEMAAVCWHAGRPRIVSLPFWHGRSAVVELDSIACLRHGREHRRRRLGTREAAERLRAQVLWPTWHGRSVERAVEALDRLVRQVPVAELAFVPEPSVWQVLGEAAA